MLTTNLIGIDPSFTPLSNAFNIDIINEKSMFKKDILSVVKVTVSIFSEFVNSFTVLDKNYSCVYINIDARFDYICNENSLNYESISLCKLINICTDNLKYDKRCNLHCAILDSAILSIDNNEVDFYVAYGCCLC